MSEIKDKIHNFCKKANVVATVHTEEDLELLEQEGVDPAIDVLEFRLDNLSGNWDDVEKLAENLETPLLFTARHPAEGGVNDLSGEERLAVLRRFLPLASLVDVEVRSLKEAGFGAFLEEITRAGALTVLSFHHFTATPPVDELKRVISEGRQAGADIVKLAVYLEDMERLSELALLVEKRDFPLSAMGMGPLGRVSRLTLAHLGSVLNYGYLRQPNAPGQWPAVELKEKIEAGDNE